MSSGQIGVLWNCGEKGICHVLAFIYNPNASIVLAEMLMDSDDLTTNFFRNYFNL